jgi:sugar phosphate isomerase/epimerase
MSRRSGVTRREMLRRLTLGAAGVAAAPIVAEAQQRRPYGPFRMGIQSYSLRHYKVDEALDHTKNLGLRYWEAYSAHVPLTTDPAAVKQIQDKLAAANVRLRAHGVTGFGADKDANRKVFEAAKALGITTITADPSREALDQLEQLVEEFQINIAIHNHGPRHRYDKIQDVVSAVNGRHKRIGASVDTGHFLRSSENPVKAIEALGERVYSVHLKDVKDAKQFTILGKGDLDLLGTLKALNQLRFREVLALEYEENPQNPIADLQECLTAVRAAVDKL